MYAYLIGKVMEIEDDNLVLEVGNIGYNVRVPASVAAKLPPIGGEVKIYTYTSVREDAMQLFGFLTKDDLRMYRMLINVNGIGPKGGLAILSAMSADELRMAVAAQDARAIARAPGIGSKTAQRILLDLKDKISLSEVFEPKGEMPAAQTGPLDQARTEAVEALTALGYPASDALRAVKAVEQENMDAEGLLKAALRMLY